MNKRTRLLVLLLSGVFLFLGCNIINQLKQGIAHTASQINSVQAIDSSREFATVQIEYIFTGTSVSASKVVIGREGNARRDTLNIVLAGTVYTDADTLAPSQTYSYVLWLLDGTTLTAYDTVEVKTLSKLEIVSPADTLRADKITVKWKNLGYGGEGDTKYKIALYDAKNLDLTDPNAFLKLLTSPVETKEVTLSSSDPDGTIELTTALPSIFASYAVMVSTESLLGVLVNKSTGIKPFLWSSI